MLETGPSLRIIKGGRFREVQLGNARVVVTERAYRRPDAIFLEENTRLGMGGARRVSGEHTPGWWEASVPGGSVQCLPGKPIEFLLIVNAGRRGGCRPGWLEPAWRSALEHADTQAVATIVSPLIGCVGGASIEMSLAAMASVLTTGPFQRRTIELVCGDLAPVAFEVLSGYAHPLRN
jgi:hypothetical protein